MSKCLSKFYVSVSRKDGTLYKRNSLLSVRAALDCHVISVRTSSLTRDNDKFNIPLCKHFYNHLSNYTQLQNKKLFASGS